MADSWDFPLNARRCQFILHARICALAAFKERAEDSLRRSKIPVLLPILRNPRFRAHAAHAFTQRRRTSYWPALKNPFLRGSRRLLSPISPIFRFSKRTAAIGYAVLAACTRCTHHDAQVGYDSHKNLCPSFQDLRSDIP